MEFIEFIKEHSKTIALVLIVLGIVLLITSALITNGIKNNSNLEDMETFFGGEITPEGLSSLAGTARMFGYELDGGTRFAISMYAKTPAMTTWGWILLAAGVVAMIFHIYNEQKA